MLARGVNIGRKRGEFEQATKTMRSIAGGHRDPRAAGVPDISDLADAYRRAAAKFCAQKKEGRLARGVPDKLWLGANAADHAHPAGYTGRALETEHMPVFLSETVDLQIRAGHAITTRGGRTLAWCEPELFAHLGSGYRLTIRYDATEPELGAAVFNRELGGRNRDGFGPGQLLGIAEYAPECPQVTSGIGVFSDVEERAAGHKRRYDGTVHTEYRATGVFGQRARTTSESRGTRSGTLRVEGNTPGGDGVVVTISGGVAEAARTLGAVSARKAREARRAEIDVAELERFEAEQRVAALP